MILVFLSRIALLRFSGIFFIICFSRLSSVSSTYIYRKCARDSYRYSLQETSVVLKRFACCYFWTLHIHIMLTLNFSLSSQHRLIYIHRCIFQRISVMPCQICYPFNCSTMLGNIFSGNSSSVLFWLFVNHLKLSLHNLPHFFIGIMIWVDIGTLICVTSGSRSLACGQPSSFLYVFYASGTRLSSALGQCFSKQ